ncbi:MAG: hypothetical protein DRG09_04370 [Epsilonproteobacteria bacterium]|nr:MAG: hypothetical protein DRG09_04370 [Campylobacterota bacterium]
MKTIAYRIGVLSILLTLAIGIFSMENFSFAVLGFLLWSVSPYLYTMFVIKLVSHKTAVTAMTVILTLTAMIGIFIIYDAMYIVKDAQSALALVVIPLYQWGLLLLSTLPIYLIHKRA